MAKELGVLIHYGATELKPVAKIENNNWVKPKGGLWTSPIESNWAWKHWCESEQFRDCDEENSFTISLKPDAKILKIDEAGDLMGLPKKILIESIVYPDFEKLAEMYDAIWLTEKGQWETRYSQPMSLYGWDCESVLILNESCIDAGICV